GDELPGTGPRRRGAAAAVAGRPRRRTGLHEGPADRGPHPAQRTGPAAAGRTRRRQPGRRPAGGRRDTGTPAHVPVLAHDGRTVVTPAHDRPADTPAAAGRKDRKTVTAAKASGGSRA